MQSGHRLVSGSIAPPPSPDVKGVEGNVPVMSFNEACDVVARSIGTSNPKTVFVRASWEHRRLAQEILLRPTNEHVFEPWVPQIPCTLYDQPSDTMVHIRCHEEAFAYWVKAPMCIEVMKRAIVGEKVVDNVCLDSIRTTPSPQSAADWSSPSIRLFMRRAKSVKRT